MNITKIKPRYIYLLAFFFMMGVFYLAYQRYKMHLDTMENGERLKVRAEKVVCGVYGSARNYFVFRAGDGNHIVNIETESCENLREGDSVDVLYNKDFGLYFPTIIDTSNDKWGMTLGISFMLLCLYYLLFRKDKQQR
jgi:hypothetical protein